jgi:four helix bundle protein
MRKIRDFEDLEVWQQGKSLVIRVYEITGSFPDNEVYGITSQLKRAALSVPANIAEGFGRFHFLDKAKFYLNARGSLYELKSHLTIAKELRFVELETYGSIGRSIETLSYKLNRLISATRKLKNAPHKRREMTEA